MTSEMEWFWLPAVPALLGWLLTIAFGILGATTVRRVDPRAGWMIVVACTLEVLGGIAGMIVPMWLSRTHAPSEMASSLGMWGLFAGTMGLVVRSLVLAAVLSLVTTRQRRPREAPAEF